MDTRYAPINPDARVARQMYRESLVDDFLAETSRPDPEGYIRSQELMEKYAAWCAERGARVIAFRSLSPILQSRGMSKVRESSAGRRKGYLGRSFDV